MIWFWVFQRNRQEWCFRKSVSVHHSWQLVRKIRLNAALPGRRKVHFVGCFALPTIEFGCAYRQPHGGRKIKRNRNRHTTTWKRRHFSLVDRNCVHKNTTGSRGGTMYLKKARNLPATQMHCVITKVLPLPLRTNGERDNGIVVSYTKRRQAF